MAISTPTYTPVRNYAFGFFLSIFLLFADINYQTFAPLRSFFYASGLYAQIITDGIFDNLTNSLSSFQNNRKLIQENKELRDQILKIRTQDFIQRKDNEEKIQIINFYKNLVESLKIDNIYVYKIASIDLKNYFCCSTHRIFLQNTNNVQIGENTPVFAARSFIGQTKNTHMNFIEVILFSDIQHVLPIKSNFFYCDARGKGKPMLISCKVNKNNDDFENNIGDAIFTSGLGGIFLKDIEIGFISAINIVSMSEIEVVITLKANPLEETFYGMMSTDINEI
tara:strand:+ start:1040 stop:1882 length:843 start_codon:yes stop_codon:yes gene_type:complete